MMDTWAWTKACNQALLWSLWSQKVFNILLWTAEFTVVFQGTSSTLSVPEYGAYNFPCWSCLHSFSHFWQYSMHSLQGLLFLFRSDMWHVCVISGYNLAQKFVFFLVVTWQGCESNCRTLSFVFPCQHLEHQMGTEFLIAKILCENSIKYGAWNSKEIQGESQNCETSSHFFRLPYRQCHHSPKAAT